MQEKGTTETLQCYLNKVILICFCGGVWSAHALLFVSKMLECSSEDG